MGHALAVTLVENSRIRLGGRTMGYSKHHLNLCDEFQLAVAAREAARMLVAYEQEQPGPVALASEAAGVGGWDDIVTFHKSSSGHSAHHWQIKNQTTDFKGSTGKEALARYFKEADEHLRKPSPYGEDMQIAADQMVFHFGFPSGSNVRYCPNSKDVLEFRHLETLAKACQGDAHVHVATHDAPTVEFNSSAERWLECITDWLGPQATRKDAARLARQIRVETLGAQEDIDQVSYTLLSTIWSSPSDCLHRIKDALRKSPPEARIGATTIHRCLDGMGRHQPASCRLVHCEHGYYFLGVHEASEAVEQTWANTHPSEPTLYFAPSTSSESDIALRTQVLRLVLHGTGVRAFRAIDWYAPARDGLRGCMGTTGRCACLGSNYFSDVTFQPNCLAANNEGKSARSMADELGSAMDDWLWKAVRTRVDQLLGDAEPQLAVLLRKEWEAYSELAHGSSPPLFRLALKASGEHRDVVADLRAGPQTVDLLAHTLLVAVALRAVHFVKGDPDKDANLGYLGPMPVRPVAVEQGSCPKGGADRPGGVPLSSLARDLFSDNETVFALGGRTSAAELCVLAGGRTITGGDGAPKATCLESPPIVFAADCLFDDAIRTGKEAVIEYFKQRISSAGNALRAQAEAAISHLKEQSNVG